MSAEVAIVLVNYNGYADTIECLDSLLRLTYFPVTIFVVDNASTDDSVQHLQEWAASKMQRPNVLLPSVNQEPPKPLITLTTYHESHLRNSFLPAATPNSVTLITSATNKGFAGGNNLATEFILSHQAHVAYIWYLNNDTVVQPDTLTLMVQDFNEKIRQGVKLGIMGAKLMFYHNPQLIQAIGATYNKWYGTSKHVGCNEPDQGQYDLNPDQIALDYIVGASMLVSKEFLEQVGLMSPDYFLYYEELDWVLRGKELGFTYTYSPKSIVYHKEGKSTGGSSQQVLKSYTADFYNISNRLIITRKYFPGYRVPVYLSLVGVIFNRIRRGQFSRVKMVLKILRKSLFSSSRN